MGLDVEAEVSRQVIGAAIQVHRSLGPGLLESVYEECLRLELEHNSLSCERQVPLALKYRGKSIEGAYHLDLVVAHKVVVEIKSVERLLPIHDAQLLTYLRLSSYPIDLLLNFNSVTLKDGLRRFVTTASPRSSASPR